MKILIANNQLNNLGGSETFTFTLIEELVSRGYHVEYFTFEFGLVSDRIEQDLKVSFMSKKKYDLILANHNTCVKKLYKFGFIIQTCHGIFPKLEQPSSKANAYVSISTEVQNHLGTLGFPSILIHNSINLKRFQSIKPINKKLETVLSLCHSKEANEFVKRACTDLEVNFLKAFKYGDTIWNIEEKINEADLVVGLGRSAYEAMACGRPVLVYDNRRYFDSCGDGYVKDKLGFSLQNNCSGRYTRQSFTLDLFKKELQKYNANDGLYFRNFAEKELNVKHNIERYLNFWKENVKNNIQAKKQRKIKLSQEIIGVKNTQRLIKALKQISIINNDD
ncbi:UDP-glycosyltransferase [Xanthomarina sp. F1114]|uniref:UDP-glycosyltransferase n=1 Tax=Xanthomarina sp. F1114 TaxID=2996019 RepID=UPI00225DF7E7|nr:UDP-glycosyltransferase [Xanthomarina sp. F1114]MCX7549054.1 UDP-glycosyltransferase [Xanthomarina sp. F1114]